MIDKASTQVKSKNNQTAAFLLLQTPFACHTMNSILQFYLETVLPTALSGVTEDVRDLKPDMESIQHIFDELKADLTRCVSS